MKIHYKTLTGIKCNVVRLGRYWFVTKNKRKVTCKKCLAMLLGIHVGEMYQFNIPKVAFTNSEVELI